MPSFSVSVCSSWMSAKHCKCILIISFALSKDATLPVRLTKNLSRTSSLPSSSSCKIAVRTQPESSLILFSRSPAFEIRYCASSSFTSTRMSWNSSSSLAWTTFSGSSPNIRILDASLKVRWDGVRWGVGWDGTEVSSACTQP